MSFLKPLAQSGMLGLGGMIAGGGDGLKGLAGSGMLGLGGLAGSALLGHHRDDGGDAPQPSRVSMIADRIGNASNLIAAGGGATPAYQAPQRPQASQPTAAPGADFSNIMQFLTPESLDHIRSMFGGYAR